MAIAGFTRCSNDEARDEREAGPPWTAVSLWQKKGGSAVGKTKRGKGTKLMVLVDGGGLPLESAFPGEVTLAEATLAEVKKLCCNK